MSYLLNDLKEMTVELSGALEVFGGDAESQLWKLGILNKEEKLCEFLKHVSPEFAGLKELMHVWRRVIDLAYRFLSGMKFN